MYTYLLWLSASNLATLITAIPALLNISQGVEGDDYSTAFYKVTLTIFSLNTNSFKQAHIQWPLTNTFCVSSVYIIISMTINRFIAIFKPTAFERLHTLNNAWLCITFDFSLSFLLHLPTCFRKTVVFNTSCSNTTSTTFNISGNGTRMDCGWQSLENTEMVESSAFKVYLLVSQILFRFGPIVLLAILNTLIIFKCLKIAKKKVMLKEGEVAVKADPSSSTSNPDDGLPFPQRRVNKYQLLNK